MLTRYQNIFLAQLCVHKMIDVMQVEKSLTIDMAKARVLEFYWEVVWYPYLTFLQRCKSNSLQGRGVGASARVIRTLATSTRFRKARMMIGRSKILCHIP